MSHFCNISNVTSLTEQIFAKGGIQVIIVTPFWHNARFLV